MNERPLDATAEGIMAIVMETGRRRVVIENITPEIDDGQFAIKRIVGDRVRVSADALTDGHDRLSCLLKYRKEEDPVWEEVPMEFVGNDRWEAEFSVIEVGRYRYTVEAWIDRFKTWRENLAKRIEAGQKVAVDLQVGAELVRSAARRAAGHDAEQLNELADILCYRDPVEAAEFALGGQLLTSMAAHPDRRLSTVYAKELPVLVERERAACGAWYELFPRSCAAQPGRHGTLQDCRERLPYIAELGFDVLYLTPIHPIGRTNRKGHNAAPLATDGDPGSPWAIGAEEGGHMAIHPQLGTLADFEALVEAARHYGLEVALDLAYQCAPDHPYLTKHPDWFTHRPDGSVQYAENPPKKYEDIYPLDFETEDWRALWQELKEVVAFWMRHGVRIIRVDNPHTKPFPFWRWLLAEVREEDPGVIFLAEAFTRPKVMYDLAKVGFSQSYTYFTWRTTKEQLTQYFMELTQSEVREYFRPHLWPNTPDILPEHLQYGGRAAFLARLVLAATLSANYGIYGPAFELMENRPREPGSEEYLDSEKYQIRHWKLDSSDSLAEMIRRVNRIRHEQPALQRDGNLRFHCIDNDQLLCYIRQSADQRNTLLVAVNLDPCHTQAGWVELPLEALGLPLDQPYQVHDLLADARYVWKGPRNYVQLGPDRLPAHIFALPRRVRTEQQFESFM